MYRNSALYYQIQVSDKMESMVRGPAMQSDLQYPHSLPLMLWKDGEGMDGDGGALLLMAKIFFSLTIIRGCSKCRAPVGGKGD